MKKVILSIVVATSLGFTGCKNPNQKKGATSEPLQQKEVAAYTVASFGVRGNCGMCKNTIENAVGALEGTSKADWDRLRKKMDVSYDASKTNLEAIHKAISEVGYDTEKVKGSQEAYANLPLCCKYNHSMEMNLKGAVKDDGKGH